MKKSILALLVLLFLLILTCVYQKTDLLYEKSHDKTSITLDTIASTPLPVKKEKEITISKSEAEVLHQLITQRKQSTISTPAKQNDIEEIDTLMQALKEREGALMNRDAYEVHLQELIKRALENRSAAIAHMNKEELHLIELQKELIKARDRAYNKIGQTNNPTSGE